MTNHQNKLCHVGDTYHQIEKESIRQTVCRDLLTEYEIGNNDYCLLHAPTLDKDTKEFDRVFLERISRDDSDFRAVVFPTPIDFSHHAFDLPLNFLGAIFLSSVDFYKVNVKYVYFDYARFYGRVQFHACFFSEVTKFNWAIFNREAWFTGCHFKVSEFDHVTFKGDTRFNRWAKFIERADFSSARFLGPTDFDTVTFECSVSFNEAEFGEDSRVSFLQSSFQDRVSFQKAIFMGYLNLEAVASRELFGDNASLSLRKARVEAPEKVSFHSARLKPRWFVEVDSRKFVFTNVRWESAKDKRIRAKDELSSPENGDNTISYPNLAKYRLLSIACRQLADNSETNNRFEEASEFRRVAMDTEWLEKRASLRNWIGSAFKRTEKLNSRFRAGDFLIHGLYRFTSRYGESWAQASGILLLLLFVGFPLICTQTDFQICPKETPVAMSLAVCESKDEQVKRNCKCTRGGLGFGEAVVHSLTTATLQNVDYRKPITKKGETVVILEKIFAPLQAALLALALRRKFMR